MIVVRFPSSLFSDYRRGPSKLYSISLLINVTIAQVLHIQAALLYKESKEQEYYIAILSRGANYSRYNLCPRIHASRIVKSSKVERKVRAGSIIKARAELMIT